MVELLAEAIAVFGGKMEDIYFWRLIPMDKLAYFNILPNEEYEIAKTLHR